MQDICEEDASGEFYSIMNITKNPEEMHKTNRAIKII